MTSAPTGTPSAESVLFSAMLRTALLPSLACGLAGIIVLWIARGPSGALGAAGGVVVSLVFFVAGLLVMRRLSDGNPLTLMVAALAVFLGQIIFLGVIILVLGSVSWLDGVAFGVGALVVALAWQVFQIRAFIQSRRPVFDSSSIPRGVDASGSVE
ncbi:MAG: hypothetical protein ABI083_15290 [Lapillicoccus sp.]